MLGFPSEFCYFAPMEILLAPSAGFCTGVRRAVDLTLHASTVKEGKISTYGPLVHNPQVIELLTLREVDCAEQIDQLTEGLAVIRTHGVPPEDRQAIVDKGLKVLDATCPKVSRVQKLVESHVANGYHVVIVGEPDHPEVKGLRGYGGDNCTVIDSLEEIETLPRFDKVCLLAQTTQNLEEFEQIRSRLTALYPDVVVKNTICAATRKRQDEIRQIASQVEAMVVIGGRTSGNTKRLVAIARDECDLPTFWIETDTELREIDFSGFEKIGVTAGASTPSWIIDRVMARLEQLEQRRNRPLLSRLRKLVRLAVVSNIYTAFAAGCLYYVGSVFMDIPFRATLFLLVVTYVLAMHVLNRFTETGVEKFRDDPMRQHFYERHRRFMLMLGISAMAAAILLSIRMGVLPFLLVLAASISGVMYSVKVVPKTLLAILGFRRLKDIAASKNFFVASAWAVVSVFPLFLIEKQSHYQSALAAFVFLFLVTALRSIYMDLSDIASDRLVGRDSVPIVFGEKRTWNLIRAMVVVLFGFCYLLAYADILPGLATIIAFWILLEYVVLEYMRGKVYSRKRSVIARDLVVDGHFIVAGLIALVWKLLT